MRKAGDFVQETHAKRFADYLLTEGIETKVEEEPDGWQVWVIEEKHLDDARFEYEQFIEVPEDPLYTAASREAEQIRRRKRRKEKEQSKNEIELGKQWRRRPAGLYPLTLTLIGLSIVATFYTGGLFPPQGEEAKLRSNHVKSELALPAKQGDEGFLFLPKSVLAGQVWRLITPIFPHLGPMHLLFNMLFLFYIGQVIEIRRGIWIYLGMVLALAVISNLCSFWWYIANNDPTTGFGMSGVLYGLFGYAWVKSQFEPSKGIFINASTVFILMAWLFLCMTGLVGPIGNAAHVSGLLAGAAISYAPIAWSDFQRGRRSREE